MHFERFARAQLATFGLVASGALALGSLGSMGCKSAPPPPAASPAARPTAASAPPPTTCDTGLASACLAEAEPLAKSADPKAAAAAAPLLDKACQLRAFGACTRLGHMLMDGRGLEIDVPRAVTLFREACEGADVEGCFAMGRLSGMGGIESLFDPERAAQRYYVVGCNGGIADACAELAIMTAIGLGTEKNLEAALGLAQKACDARSTVGCAALGAIVAKAASDFEASARAFERACSLGGSKASAWACARIAHLQALGIGVARDEKKAKASFDHACAVGLDGKPAPENDPFAGCVAIGMVYEAGGHPVLAEKDPTLALALFSHACERKSALGCAARGIHHERAGKKQAAAADFRKACSLGAKEACDHLKKK